MKYSENTANRRKKREVPHKDKYLKNRRTVSRRFIASVNQTLNRPVAVTAFKMAKIHYALFLLFAVHGIVHACPQQCHCNGKKMTCERMTLTKDVLKTLVIPSNITEVVLDDNELSELSQYSLRNFKHLLALRITNNRLTSLPDNLFNGFSNLKSLILNNNLLTSLRSEIFNGLDNLRRLEIKDNKIQELTPGVFNDLYFIQIIRLSGNEIKEVPDGVFTPLKWLRDLFLTGNKLARIGEKAFQNLTMNRLLLSSNKLTTIPVKAFKGFQISGKMILLDNPLDCHCEHAMNYAVRLPNLRNKVWGYCKTPYYMLNKHVMLAHNDMQCTLCDLQPCTNGGHCSGNKTAFNCACPEKFKGKSCEVSICQAEVKYITKIVEVPVIKTVDGGSTIPLKQKIINRTEYIVVKKKVHNRDDHQKLMILYAMCALEFIVILCFVAYFGLRRYNDWKLQKKYEHEKSRKLLLNIRNETNAKLAKSLCQKQEDEEFPFDVKNMILKGAVPV